MFFRIFASALFAGVLAGLFVAVLQQYTTVPIIVAAESYEGTGAPASATTGSHDHGSHDHGSDGHGAHDHGEGWAPDDGFERIFYTTLSSLVIAAGWGFLLVALMALSGRELSGREGLLWGIAGFVAAGLAPGMGLPPEVPGSLAANTSDRQIWWVATIAVSAAGLWLLLLGRTAIWQGVGILLLIAPHAVGAPQPDRFGGPVPPEIAAHFVAASLAVQACFWALLGWLAGTSWNWLERREAAA